MNAAVFPLARGRAQSARTRKATARLLFQRLDGKDADAAIDLPRTRRRLSAIVKQYADHTRPHIVCVYRRGQPWAVTDYSVRLRKQWRHTRIGSTDTVAIIYAPRGGAGAGGSRGGKAASIGMLVATIALAALGQFWAVGAIAGALGTTPMVAGFLYAAGSAALLAGGGYLLSRATQAKANKDEGSRPLYGVSGGGNLPRPGDRIPIIFGRCWTTPDLSQPDFTVFEGDDQILFKRVTVGIGKYSIKKIRIGGAVMWLPSGVQPPFTGAQVEIIEPGGSSTLVPGQVATVQAVSSMELPRAGETPDWAGPYTFGSDAVPQSLIQLNWTLPAGIYAVGSGRFEGKQFPTDWGVHFQYAPVDADGNLVGGWSDLYLESGNTQTTQPRRVTTFVNVPAGPGLYAYRARNLGAPPANGKVVNTVTWEGLLSHIPETIVRPHVTEIALKVRSGPGVGVTAYANMEVEVGRILPVWNGGAWIETETRKAVWAAVHILRDTVAGAGQPDSQIDIATFNSYAASVPQFDTYDGVIRGPVSVYEALQTVLGVMRASPLRLGNLWTMVRDEQKLVRKHVITRRQILQDSDSEDFNLDLSDGAADVIVEWDADGDPRKRRDHPVRFGVDTGNPRRIKAEGVTETAHAIHIATWAASTAYRRRRTRTFTLELGGRLILPNDRCLVDSWYFDEQDAVGIFGLSGFNLQLDRPFTLSSAACYGYLRARDGRSWGPVLLSQVDETTLAMDSADVAAAQAQTGLTIAQVLSTETQAPTSMVVGELDVVSNAWLVRAIRFLDSERVEIEATFDAPGVWTDLGEAIVAPPPPPSAGLVNQSAIDIAYIFADARQRGTQMYMDWSAGRPRVPVNYVVRISYDDWETYEDAYHGTQSSGTYPVRDTNDFIKVRAFAYAQDGQRSAIRETQFSAPQAVVSGQTAKVRIDYNELVAGIRYRTSLIPDLSPLFDLVAENQVEALLGSRLAETGIRKTEQVKTDLTQAIAVTREELAAQIASDRAYVEETKIALLDADQALAAKQETFDVQLGESRTAIQQEAIARASAVSALAQGFDSYKASINGRMATAESGIQALATQQGAFAQQLTSLNASFGGFTAGGKVQFAAVAAPSGVFARYAVVLNASNGSRYESGLYYELIQSGASFYSQFFIDASRFYIGNPLTRTVPFAVVDGVTYIDNAVIRSGSLSRHAFGAGTTSASASIPIQPDGQVIAQVVYAGSQTLANGEAGFIYVYRNGTLIKQQTVDTHQIAVSGGNILTTYGNTVVQVAYNTYAAGTDTISVSLGVASGTPNSLQLSGITLQVSSFMK